MLKGLWINFTIDIIYIAALSPLFSESNNNYSPSNNNNNK